MFHVKHISDRGRGLLAAAPPVLPEAHPWSPGLVGGTLPGGPERGVTLEDPDAPRVAPLVDAIGIAPGGSTGPTPTTPESP